MTSSRREIQAVAQELRKRHTPAEALLWNYLRGRRLAGLKFRRQHPIGPYIVDFCCIEHGLIIELDGAGHADQIEYDTERTLYLEACGYRVLRFANDEVERDTGAILRAIERAADGPHPPAPSPVRTGEGE